MKLFRRILIFLLLIIVFLSIAITYTLYNWTQGPLPQHDGEIRVSGLKDTVEIFRDESGVPHIYASNTYDLFLAQGYTLAQDRWWQMEFARHIGAGRIQELTGQSDAVMGSDLAIRTMGWYKTAQYEIENVYDPETLAILQAFADGVNAYITSREPGKLAFEYNVLGVTGVNIEIERWTPVDSVVWGKVMAWQLADNGDELTRSGLAEYVSEDMLADFFPPYPFDKNPTVILEEDLPLNDDSLARNPSQSMLGVLGVSDKIAGSVSLLNHPLLTKIEGIGSNNWVAGGDLTKSGLPLLANDMHLGHQMPSIWYEIGLHCQPVSADCPYDIVGFQFAPSPLVTAGHNSHIAWGFTDHTDDVIDYFLIEVNPDNELQYRWNDGWRDMEVREEVIHFGDSVETVTIQVRETHLGPIINDNQLDENGQIMGFNNEDPRVLRWTGLEPSQLLTAVNQLAKAMNWQEFREALVNWSAPAQHIVYADIDGNIGMQVPGWIPIRANGHVGNLPVSVSSDEQDWLGFIPFDELPRVYNPARAYIESANQMTVPPAYFSQLQENLSDEFGEDANYMYLNDYAEGYRANRIATLLESLAPHDAGTFKQIHGDNYDAGAELIVPLLLALKFEDEKYASARDWQADWDYYMDANSGQAALYGIFFNELWWAIFEDQLTEYLEEYTPRISPYLVIHLLDQPENDWWDDVATNAVETRDNILHQAFVAGYDRSVELLGEDESDWQWGTIHHAEFESNPLGLSGIPQLEAIVNRYIPVGGGPISVNAAWTGAGTFNVEWGVSERVIYDLSNWDASQSIHPTGQSGHPYSPHYDDMLEPWSTIQYKPMLWSREAVEIASVSKLTLVK